LRPLRRATTPPPSDPSHSPAPRAFVRALVAFRAGDDFGVGEAYDMSATGIFVVTHHDVPTGSPIQLKLRVEGANADQTLIVSGSVVRSATTPGPGTHARGFAVHFGDPSAEAAGNVRPPVPPTT